MGIRERLLEVRDTVGTNAELARIAECSRSNVTQWLEGDIKSLKAVSALNIQEKTGYSARWLVLGHGAKKTGGTEAPAPSIPDAKIKEPKNSEEKLLVIIRAFQETDQRGRDAIWAGAKIALKRGAHGKRSTSAVGK